ncbi:MAG: hypothetical protein JNJ73_06760 [Hyphomonadaceae bacterium]|nr:hypothetical protein [Hyphomonadaceae bacterium]
MNEALRASMHARDTDARDILQRYEHDGLPFVLFLRDFGYQRQIGPADGDMEPLHNSLAAALPPGVGVFYVQDQKHPHTEDFKSRLRAEEKPAAAFLLRDENWQEQVTWLVERASLIVCEMSFLKPGTAFELDRILAARQLHKTILVMPGLDEPFLAPLDHEPFARWFLRVAYPHDFAARSLTEHICAADLVARLAEIAAARSAREDKGAEALAAHTPPVTYANVAQWHCRRAFACDIDMNEEARAKFTSEDGLAKEDRALQHRARLMAFWSYYRGFSVYEYVQAAAPAPPEEVFERYVALVRVAEMAISEASELYMESEAAQIALGRNALRSAEALDSYLQIRFDADRLTPLREVYARIP